MDYMVLVFATVGARLAPLSSLDEIAGFFFAASANAPNVPSCASTIAQRLGVSVTDAACMLSPMLETLSSMPRVQKILALLPPVENMSLGADRTTCVVCEGALEPAEQTARTLRYSTAVLRQGLHQDRAALQEEVLVLRRRTPYVVRGTSRVLAFELCRF